MLLFHLFVYSLYPPTRMIGGHIFDLTYLLLTVIFPELRRGYGTL